MPLRLNHDRPEAEVPPASADGATGGLVIALPEHPQGEWRWWRVSDGALGQQHGFALGEDAPWGDAADLRVVAFAPAALAPVRQMPRGDMPAVQALAAARLDPPGLRAPFADTHVAVAITPDQGGVLSATVARADMDVWLAGLASAGLDAAALVPAAVLLPQPAPGEVTTGNFAGQSLARTSQAAFAGEDGLLPMLAPGLHGAKMAVDDLAARLLAQFDAPELDLRQGVYARPRVAYFRLPDWRQLARMAAILALLICAIFVVETVKLNRDAAAREDAAIAAAQARFPGVGDLATAETQIRGELLRRGAGGVAFADSAPAVFAAMQPNPSIRLRNMNWRADGTLAVRAAAPTSDALNQMLITLQNDGWIITVPPQIAPDATGETVADITVRAP